MRPSAAPTARQLEILALIKACIDERGSAPTMRELCDLSGVRSTNAIACVLRPLERHGLLHMGRRGCSRDMHVPAAGLRALRGLPPVMSRAEINATVDKFAALIEGASSSVPIVQVDDMLDRLLGRPVNEAVTRWRAKIRGETP